MCRVCEHPCWRDGGEAECDFSDSEFVEQINALDTLSGTIDLMERLQYSLAANKKSVLSVRRAPSTEDR